MTDTGEKSSKFMNWFWDLAADDMTRRCMSATMIIKYITETQKKIDEGMLSTDCEYTLKRLIRGLSSSRDSARQGFSACLCQLLCTFTVIDLNKVVSMLDDTTKSTGGMKGSEERDVMFGRLFGYLALIRSGRLQAAPSIALHTLDRLIELHKRKAWIREVVSEAILFLLPVLPAEDISIAQSAVSKLSLIVERSVEPGDLTAHEVVLLSGLQKHAHDLRVEGNDAVADVYAALTPDEQILSSSNIPALGPTLLAACSGFPKIHRAWYCILIAIFGSDSTRQLPRERLSSLSVAQEGLLIAFVDFVDGHLLPVGGSHEKKGVALKLVTELARLTPISLLPIVLSQTIVRAIVAIRSNTKNSLFDMAGAALKDISSCPGTREQDLAQTKLAIANALVLHGGAMFDIRSHTTTVEELLSNLDVNMVLQHVTSLCRIISDTATSESSEESTEEDDEARHASAIAAISALYAIVRNPRIACRGTISAVIVGVLVRLSCFGSGITTVNTPALDIGSSAKKVKKSKKKAPLDAFAAFVEQGMDEVLAKDVLDMVRVLEGSSGEICPDTSVVSVASSRVLAILADIGHASVEDLNHSIDMMAVTTENGSAKKEIANDKKSENKIEPTLLNVASGVLFYLSQQDHPLTTTADESGKEQLSTVRTTLQMLRNKNSGEAAATSRLVSSFATLLVQATFHVYCSSEVDAECLGVICDVIPALLGGKASATNNSEDSDDEESPQTELFGACMDLLAVSASHSVKGIRDAIKRVWGSIVQYCDVEQEVVDAILLSVIGNDIMPEVDEDKDESEEGEQNDDEEGSEEESDVDEDAEESADEEDMVLGEEDTMRMLEASDSEGNSDDEGSGLKHDESADAALAHMIQMRKQNRKQGLLQAKRQELIVRSRAIDILEVFLHRNENCTLLLPMFRPLMYCLKKVSTSSLCQSLQEGRAFQQRLRSLIESKLSKAKFSVLSVSGGSTPGEDEVEFTLSTAREALVYICSCLRSPDVGIRQVALPSFICLSRAIISGHNQDAMGLLAEHFREGVDEYFNKKNSRMAPKLVEELLNRYPDFSVPVSLEIIVAACEIGKTVFLRCEAYRLLGCVLKKYAMMSDENKTLFCAVLPTVLTSISSVLNSDEAGEVKAKRIKSVLSFAKDLAQFIKNNKSSDSRITPELESEFRVVFSASRLGESSDIISTFSAAVKRLFEQVCNIAKDFVVIDGGRKKSKKSSKKAEVNVKEPLSDATGPKKHKKNKRKKGAYEEDDDGVDYEKALVREMMAQNITKNGAAVSNDQKQKRRVKRASIN